VQDLRGWGALDAAWRVAERFADRAKSHATASSDLETREMLEEIADFVCERSA
jgi:geranylgeranyl pyrophosphate synthase